MNTCIELLFKKQTLTKNEAKSLMQFIIEKANPEQTAACLSLLKYRGEKPQEIAGMVEALQAKEATIKLDYPVLDIVGTGGDFSNTVNISTGSAILAAACGVPIVKHGNRFVSSHCGSADVLEAFGIDIEMPAEYIGACLREVNIGFLYAPIFYPILNTIRPIRKALQFSTVFNLLGPLLNPVKAEYILLGVSHESQLEVITDALIEIGRVKSALVFHGCGLDELTPLGKMVAFEIRNGLKKKIIIDPHSLGFSTCRIEDLKGKDAFTNATLLRDAFSGIQNAISDSLTLNAAAALMIFDQASSLAEGINIARKVLEEGLALKLIERWITFSKNTKASRVL